MSEVNPDVLAQMKRLHSALNDGTVDVVTANDALRQLHDFLTGAAYEPPRDPVEEAPSTHEEEEVEPEEEGGAMEEGEGDEHPHKRKARRKR